MLDAMETEGETFQKSNGGQRRKADCTGVNVANVVNVVVREQVEAAVTKSHTIMNCSVTVRVTQPDLVEKVIRPSVLQYKDYAQNINTKEQPSLLCPLRLELYMHFLDLLSRFLERPCDFGLE